jgi:hypothetical protein
MKTKDEMIDKFEIEELENRFEMGKWLNFGEVKIGIKYDKVMYEATWDISN